MKEDNTKKEETAKEVTTPSKEDPKEEVTYSVDENGVTIKTTIIHTVDENGNPITKKKITKIKKVSKNKEKEKLSGPFAFLFSVGLIALAVYSAQLLMQVDKLYDYPKGLTDLEEVLKSKPLNPEELIESVDIDARKMAVNFLLKDNKYYNENYVEPEEPQTVEPKEETEGESKEEKKEDTKSKEKDKSDFIKYLENLPNNDKLVLGGIDTILDFDGIKDNLRKKFNTDLKVEPLNLSITSDNNTKEIYIYNEAAKSYYFNYIYKDEFLKKFDIDGEMIIYEYDAERVDQTTIKVITKSLFLIKKDGKSYLNNKDKSLVE